MMAKAPASDSGMLKVAIRVGPIRRRNTIITIITITMLIISAIFTSCSADCVVWVRSKIGVTTLTAYAAPIVNNGSEHPVISAIDARHDHVYLQVVAGNGSPLLWPRLASIEEALDAARFGAPYLVGNAAKILGERWPTDAPPPLQVDAQTAPDIAWVGWLGAAVSPDTAPARPYYLRAPDAKPQKDMLRQAAQPSVP